MAKDFFISYTSANRRWAEWIAWQLEEAGYTTVLQAWDFSAGQNCLANMDNRNPNFTGREALLADIWTKLTSGQPTALNQAIRGLGGVGKTQLAVEYAYRHRVLARVVGAGRGARNSRAQYAALAEPLNLPEKGATDQSVAVEAVRHWLARNTGWLGPMHPYVPPASRATPACYEKRTGWPKRRRWRPALRRFAPRAVEAVCEPPKITRLRAAAL